MAIIDLGADGPNWTQQNTAAGIGVTPDRRAVYIAVPRLSKVAVADVNTNAVTRLSSRDGRARPPGRRSRRHASRLVPYVIDAADDSSTMTTAGGPAVANVLANDRIGGIAATLAHVTLTQVSSTSEGLALDPASGAVTLAAGAAVGVQTLVYRICEIADPSNCDDATVTVTVLPPYVIDAVNDSGGVTFPGRTVRGERARERHARRDAGDDRARDAVHRVVDGRGDHARRRHRFGLRRARHRRRAAHADLPHLRDRRPGELRRRRRHGHREALRDRCGERQRARAEGGRDGGRQRAGERQVRRRGRHARQGDACRNWRPRTPASRSTSPPAP